jgi:hypothetical protein
MLNIARSNNSIFNYICFAIFVLTVAFLPSFFNGYSTNIGIDLLEFYDNDNFANILHRRMTDPVFTKRPVVYSIVYFIGNHSFFPYQFIYNIINVSSLISIVYFIKKIGMHYKVEVKNSIGFLFVLFPILFCVCSMVAGFDDFFHWALSLAVFYWILEKKIYLAAATFLFAVVTREAILLVLPLFFYIMDKKTSNYILFLFMAICGLYIITKVGHNTEASKEYFMNQRFKQLDYNFGSIEASLKSLWSIYISVVVPILLIKTSDLKLKKAFIGTGLFTMIILIVTIYIDETRASFYPFIFTVPFWETKINYILEHITKWLRQQIYILPVMLGIAYLFSFHCYNPCISKSCIIYQVYAFVAISVSLVCFYPYIKGRFIHLKK